MRDRLELERVLKARAAALDAMRSTLKHAGALEVVTPVACTYPDLAPVPQLKAVHPRSGTVFMLRIAPEEHLTRLIARGMKAVFEVSTNFRAETIDETHLIEFQSLEAIFADRSPQEVRGQVETLCRAVEEAVRSTVGVDCPRWCPAEPFELVALPGWASEHLGASPADFARPEGLRRMLAQLGYDTDVHDGVETLADAMIGAVARQFDRPIFVTSLPDCLGGPANPCPSFPGFLDRSELYFRGLELGSLADQVANIDTLRKRYQLNHRIRLSRGIEPNLINERCLEDYARGLPRYCGLGLGVDRLLMLSLGIDDVRQLHPFLYS
jgi:lysyl-tRNA synthetase class II